MTGPKFSPTYPTLPDSIQKVLTRVIAELHPTEILLFGSRARGDHRESSDFGLAIKAPHASLAAWARIRLAIDEEPLTLFRVDLVNWNELNDEHKNRIALEGKLLYA